MIFCFVRETKQLTLEELDRKQRKDLLLSSSANRSSVEVFSVPTKKFISYELTEWLPYFIKRYIFLHHISKPPPIIERAEKVDAVLDA